MTSDRALLTTAEMADADKLAVAAGVPSTTLMENAGRAVADASANMVSPGARIAVLCGPGNNGGDGFVAARLLQASYDVSVYALDAVEALKGDAAEMAQRWSGAVRPIEPGIIAGHSLVIDALFGAGLTRALDGPAAAIVEEMNHAGVPVLSVDVPSGLDGATGLAAGPVVRATRTVTFFRKKPGHLLMPGRVLCGETHVADIGIPDHVLNTIKPSAAANTLALWLSHFPWPRLDGHKYGRGHAVVVSGPAERTGAARLGARGALRVGAGLVTLVGSGAATAINAAHATSVMTRIASGAKAIAELLKDERLNAVLIGPGAGADSDTADSVMAVLASPAAAVLDADALTSFAARDLEETRTGFGFTAARGTAAPRAADLFALIQGRAAPVVMTPHDGEFARLFPGLASIPSKLDRAREAARLSGAIIVLKGPDTVIAAPDGRACINDNAPPWLATAGSGDVLAGFITGLLAQCMPAFDAACAAVWVHGECATSSFGPGLISEDLPERLPEILDNLHHAAGRPHWNPEKPNGGIG